jgi:hypothetical protein
MFRVFTRLFGRFVDMSILHSFFLKVKPGRFANIRAVWPFERPGRRCGPGGRRGPGSTPENGLNTGIVCAMLVLPG